MSQLRVVERSEVKLAKDGRSYFTATLSAGFGQKNVSRNFWQQYRRDPKTGLPTNVLYWERGTPQMADQLIASQETIEGSIEMRKVVPYEIGENKVDTYTTVVFPGENIEAVFAGANHNIVDESTGEVKGKVRAVLSSKTPTPTELENAKAKEKALEM